MAGKVVGVAPVKVAEGGSNVGQAALDAATSTYEITEAAKAAKKKRKEKKAKAAKAKSASQVAVNTTTKKGSAYLPGRGRSTIA